VSNFHQINCLILLSGSGCVEGLHIYSCYYYYYGHYYYNYYCHYYDNYYY